MKKTIKAFALIFAAAVCFSSLMACGNIGIFEWETEEYITEKAATAAPTTQAPTTEAPPTQAPTTEAPTTEAPTTEAPTTQAPTTQAPTTEAPTTEKESAQEAPEGFKEYTYKWLSVCVPEDFTELDFSEILTLVPATYPVPSDNINFTEAKGTSAGISESAVRALLEGTYQQAYGVGISDYTYEHSRISGGELVIARFSASYAGLDFFQSSCMVFHNGEIITMTITDVSGLYKESFKTVIESIRIME